MINIDVYEHTLQINVGRLRVFTIIVNERMGAYRKRSHKQAISFGAYNPADERNIGSWKSISVAEAMSVLSGLDAPTDDFLDICIKRGWEEAADYKRQVKMF